MGVHIRKKGKMLYLDIYTGGQRSWRKLGLALTGDKTTDKETMRLAEIARAKMMQRIFTGEYDLTDKIAGKQTLTAFAEKLIMQKKGGHLPKALRYIKEYGGDIRLDAINDGWLNKFREWILKQEALKQITAAHYFDAVCFVVRQAHKQRLIAHDPTINIKRIKEPEPLKTFLTKEELEKLAATPLGGELGAEVKKAFLFACMVGLRISDLQSLTWGDIQRTPDPTILKRQQKTQAIVGIPINASAWAVINDGKLHKAEELVFPRLTASKTDTTQYIRAWAAKAGIQKKFGWHCARHTFAVLSLEKGTDIYTVSKMLGHTDLATTQVYAKATDGMKREAVKRLEDIDLTGGTHEIIPMKKKA